MESTLEECSADKGGDSVPFEFLLTTMLRMTENVNTVLSTALHAFLETCFEVFCALIWHNKLDEPHTSNPS